MEQIEKTQSVRLHDALYGVLTACIVSLIINLPLWQGMLVKGEWQKPDVILESSDEVFYLTRIREVADGHLWAGHPYMFERRDQRYPLGNLWEAVLGTTMRVFDLRLKTITTAADALFPFVLALILWLGTKTVLPDKKWRVLLIGVLLLCFEMFAWRRPISPQETTILPLLYLWALCTPRRSTLVLTGTRGALIGLMTLSYPFHWTYCLVTEALFTLISLRQDPSWFMRMRRIAALMIPLILCALPWMVMIIDVHDNPEYLRTLERLGMLHRRLPAGFPLQGLLVLTAVCVLWVRRRLADRTVSHILLILLAAGLIVLNQPLITGKEAEFSSHYRQILVFPLWISFLWALYQLVRTRPIAARVVPIIGLILMTVQTVRATAQSYAFYEHLRTASIAREHEQRIVEALNGIPGQQIVLTEDETSRHLLTVYTPHYPFFNTSMHMYLVDDATLWERAAVQQALFPEYDIPMRGILGSSLLNTALHERTVCKLQTILRMRTDPCTMTAEQYLPPEWYALKAAHPTEADILATLRNAGVTYALMKNVPVWLRSYTTTEKTVDGYELLRFE